MSQVLKGYLDTELKNGEAGKTLRDQLYNPLLGRITDAVTNTVETFGTGSFLSGSVINYNDDGLGSQSYNIAIPEESQALYIRKLSYELNKAVTDEVSKWVSKVIADEVSAAVQTYLTTNVTTNLGLIVVPSVVGIPHTHVVPPLPLNAP